MSNILMGGCCRSYKHGNTQQVRKILKYLDIYGKGSISDIHKLISQKGRSPIKDIISFLKWSGLIEEYLGKDGIKKYVLTKNFRGGL